MGKDQSGSREEQASRRHRLARVASSRAKLAAENANTPGGVRRYEARQGRLAQIRRRDNAEERGWCILRTNSKRTLNLAQSLNDAGIEAWTPRETRKRRLPRGRKGYKETVEPIVPSFVFARAVHLPDLMRALALPSSPHPQFSIFQHAGRAPIIRDREIANLHHIEDAAARRHLKTQRPTIAVGAPVNPTEGAFAGLDGVVEEVRGGKATVCFGGHFRVEVATWLLLDDAIQAPSASTGTAALAA